VSQAQIVNLKPGRIMAVNGKLYGRCPDCDSIVRMDKWLFGALHFCLDEDEREAKARRRRR
jgi:hypothetical protein